MMLKRISVLSVLQLVSVIIFCVGFFPQKKVLKGDNDFVIEREFQTGSKPTFDKFVLVIVDALRSDFIFDKVNSNFTFVHSLLNSGEAWGYTAYSNPPTVTLPRLKGITTGSTPNFLDAILNVAEDDSSSNLNEQDSWLSQLSSRGKTIRFFGDDTWLKLFPLETFQQYDGTNSFFVSDFEEVDHNVTRHLPEQLAHQNDWDVLILHYLGLDHIGHKGGPKSHFMPSKHIEMDAIVKQIYESVDDRTLICLMGDHGMNDVGNHGGSSPGETSSGMVLMSKKLKNYDVPIRQANVNIPIELSDPQSYAYLTPIQQVDFVPTLAALLNIPIPKNSVGVIMSDILQLLDPKLATVKIKENYHQLNYMLNKGIGKQLSIQHEDISGVIETMKDIQMDLTRAATNYNYAYLNIGTVTMLIVTFNVLFVGYKKMKHAPSFTLIVLISAILGFSTFGSSLVEEEHQIWWWIVCGLILLSSIIVPDKFMAHISILICVRLIRGWNNSGQKHIYDDVTSEVLRQHSTLKWYLNLITIIILGLQGSASDPLKFVTAFLLSALCFTYKISWAIVNREDVPSWMYNLARDFCLRFVPQNEGKEAMKAALVPLAQLFFQCFCVIFLIRLISIKLNLSRKNTVMELSRYISILAIFQSPTSNIGLFLVFHILKHLISNLIVTRYDSNVYFIIIVSLVMQYFTFFQFGGTNSIATADLSNAYNGVSENYNIYFVGLMMCVSNFAPTIYWSAFKWPLLYTHSHKYRNFAKYQLVILIFNCTYGTCLVAACYLLRFHLFIWSVFSPKLCYFATWNIFMSVIIGWIIELLVV